MIVTRTSAGGIVFTDRHGGAATPLVLLHGIGSNASAWDPVIAHLPDDRRIIAWNAPGYGGSKQLAPEWPVAADYAGALETFLDDLEIDRVLLVGHSLGALMAASFAADHPGRVAALILASPASGQGAIPGGALPAPAAARIDDLARLGADAFAAARAANLIHEPERNPEAVASVRRQMEALELQGYRKAVRMLASGRLADDARRLDVPAFVVLGAADTVTPPAGIRAIFDAIPEAVRRSCAEVPEAGHALASQAPQAFAEAIGQMIAASETSTPKEAMSHV